MVAGDFLRPTFFPQPKTILARNWFSYDSRNVRLWSVVCFVKAHVPKFAFVTNQTFRRFSKLWKISANISR
jgi:hypothetical protein